MPSINLQIALGLLDKLSDDLDMRAFVNNQAHYDRIGQLLVNWHKENAFDNTLETNQHYFFQVDLNKTIQKLEKLKFFFDKNQKHESTVNAINFFQKHFIVHEDQLLSILDNSQQAQHFITEHKKYFKKIPCDQRLNVLTDYVQNRKKQMLTELSNFYSNEVDKTMKNFTQVIEPVIILVLGLAVAGMAIAVIMPMYTLVQNF